ncbi:hypothetical protein [Rummeliibacillus stabekisii]|uniref:Uncharacterized protein n=1 Tax=Rummeliibacillus stabekisii TaxID=241244 RepID=A0A143HBV4_9BACL|nr:hypothetical protein [Rummeliibacillus stabekisii]AMW99237.1 hypothetical protein ATY39_07015 [Rummeliibacillus stabekisii]
MGIKFNFDAKDFEKSVKKAALEKVKKEGVNIECPNCNKTIKIKNLKATCSCGQEITLNVDSI